MGAGSSFPIDLILFGMIAAFLVLRLRSILGRRTGLERQAPPLSTAGGSEYRRTGDRWPGRTAGIGRRPHLAGGDRRGRAGADADAFDRPQLRLRPPSSRARRRHSASS